MVDNTAESFGGIDEAAEGAVVIPDMAVGYLSDQHRARIGGEQRLDGRWEDQKVASRQIITTIGFAV